MTAIKTIKYKINEFASNHLSDGDEQLDFTKNIFDEYGADQLDEVELIMGFEEIFGIELPDQDYKTLNDFANEVLKATESLVT